MVGLRETGWVGDGWQADTDFSTGQNHFKSIPVEEFSEHVQRMHADRDKFFELEYNVSG